MSVHPCWVAYLRVNFVAARLTVTLVPLLAALGCGTTFVPSDSDGGSDDAGSGGAATDATDSEDGASGGSTSSGGTLPTDAPELTGGTSSGGRSSGGTTGDGGGGAGADGGTSSGGAVACDDEPCESYDCNPDRILCLPIIAPEPCPPGEVYSVESSCYGPCVPVSQCACESADDCPDPNGTDEYTCHGTTDHCGPWL